MNRFALTPRWTVWAVLLLLPVLGFGCGHATSPLQNKAAPDFTLPLLEGGEVTLSSHAGSEVVVLDFWAVWCGPCRQGLPAVAQVAKEFEDQPVAVYAINLGDNESQIKGFLQAEGIEIAVALDARSEVGQRYQVRGIPVTLVIDKQGIVRHSHIGYSTGLGREMTASIRALLNEEG